MYFLLFIPLLVVFFGPQALWVVIPLIFAQVGVLIWSAYRSDRMDGKL